MPSNATAKRILIVEPNEQLRQVMCRFLGKTFRVTGVSGSNEAMNELRADREYDLVLAEIDMPGISGTALATAVAEHFPTNKVALMANSRFPLDGHIHTIRRLHCYTVLVKTSPFQFDEFLIHVENILAPHRAVGIERYLRDTARITKVEIRGRDDKNRFTEEALSFFRRYRSSESDLAEIRLALEEILNNSLYHAFRKSNGQEKYKLGSEVVFDLSEQVIGCYARDEDCLAFSVSDNAGSLDAQVFLGKLERQQTQEGLLDENGRGLHLSRTVSDRMILNLRPGRLTETVLLFYHKRRPSAKPILINIINS
jgi:CheY-like chemotaxis protein/anti-sigma regulatory factor (Ser/Thr protein kinase)